MEGFIKIKINKFNRALLARSIALIPSLIIGINDKKEKFSSYLNILESI
jgi:hypothetical protein